MLVQEQPNASLVNAALLGVGRYAIVAPVTVVSVPARNEKYCLLPEVEWKKRGR